MYQLPGVCFNALATGIKSGGAKVGKKLDLGLILLPIGTVTTAVFTKNALPAAPVLVAKEHLPHSVRAFVVNSGNANAATGFEPGSRGYEDVKDVCTFVADALGVQLEQVLPFSTGVIGEYLPMSCFERNIAQLVNSSKAGSFEGFADSIMTTDTVRKIAFREVVVGEKKVRFIACAKGSGMIHPNMATMLGFILSDVMAPREFLAKILKEAVEQTFNAISVDGDTSTNDAVTLSATGTSGVSFETNCEPLQAALTSLCKELALKIVDDGEGASKRVEISVRGGVSQEACQKVADAIATSPLVGTALYASDPNWGRLFAAAGKASVAIDFDSFRIFLGDVCVFANGVRNPDYQEEMGVNVFKAREISILILIGRSEHEARVTTCDLSERYVEINASYRT